MGAVTEWLWQFIRPINDWLLQNPELVFCAFAGFVLFIHFVVPRREDHWFLLFLLSIILVVAGLFFIVLARKPEPTPFTVVAGMVVLYGIVLFVILSDALLMGGAKVLTAKRGEKWIKEMDYLYLTIGAIGILMSVNRIDFLTGRFEGTDILAPLILTTAVVIRFLKTRADIGGWNNPK
jgi:hypothetical protein